MNKSKEEYKKKSCFILTPIGNSDEHYNKLNFFF